jgi:protoheme IX farnesyltransferase
MLPVAKGDRIAAWAITGHAVALLVLTVALGLLSGGRVTTVLAALGGVWFVVEALRLQLQPTRSRAMRSFAASLVELSLVLIGVMVDAAIA